MRPNDAMFGGHSIFITRMRVFVRRTMHQHYAKDPTDEKTPEVRYSELVRETAQSNVKKNVGIKGQSVEDQLEIADFLRVIEKHPDVFPSTVRPGTTLFEALHETPTDRNDFSHATEDKSDHDAQEFLELLSEFLKACGETGFALQIEKDYIAQLGETPPASSPASRESSGGDYIAQLGETPLASSSASHESQVPRKATAGLVSKLAIFRVPELVVGIVVVVVVVAVVSLLALRGDTANSPQQVPAIANAEPSEGNGTTPGSSAESQQVQRAEQSDDGEPTLSEDNPGSSQSVQGAGDAAAPQQTQPQDADDPGNGGSPQHDNGNTSQPAQAVVSEEQADSGSPPRQDGDGSDASTAGSALPQCSLPSSSSTITEGASEQFRISCTDTAEGQLTFTADSSNPSVATVVPRTSSDGRIRITAQADGVTTITLSAANAKGDALDRVSLLVTVIAAPPVIQRLDCSPLKLVENSSTTCTASLSGGTPDAYSWSGGSSSGGGATYTTTFDSPGSKSISFTVGNASGNDTDSVSVQVVATPPQSRYGYCGNDAVNVYWFDLERLTKYHVAENAGEIQPDSWWGTIGHGMDCDGWTDGDTLQPEDYYSRCGSDGQTVWYFDRTNRTKRHAFHEEVVPLPDWWWGRIGNNHEACRWEVGTPLTSREFNAG